MNTYRLATLIFFLIFSSISCKEKKLNSVVQKGLDQIVSPEQIPGASLSIVLPGGKMINLSSGYADLEKKEKMKPDHLLFSGSVGKTYVMAVIFKMIEAGDLSLEDKVSTFFKEESWFSQIPNAEALTIEMLLNHTSGIPRYVFKPELWKTVTAKPDKVWTGKERLSFIFGDDPVHEAGKGWAYSDTNYILLGMIIEKLKGKDYYQVLEEEILQPLALKNTYPSDKRHLPGLASGYTRPQFEAQFGFPPKVTENATYCMNPQLEWTGGGINYTAEDLVKWGRLLYSGKVLSKKYTEKATTATPFETGFKEGAKYGCGTIIWEKDGIKSYGHTGFMFGYVAIVEYIPEYDVALSLLLNSDNLPKGHDLHEYLNQIKSILLNEISTTT